MWYCLFPLTLYFFFFFCYLCFYFTNLRLSLDQHRLACLLSASQLSGGTWLNAVHSSSAGPFLDDKCTLVGVAICLGLKLCEHHRCRCGASIDEFVLHPLFCCCSAGHFPRHAVINIIIRIGLDADDFPSEIEPVGLDCGDAKRPDGITIFLFKIVKSLI